MHKESAQANGSLKFYLIPRKNSCGRLKHWEWTHHWHFSLLGFFYNGLNFVLRGGQEHTELKISQLNFRTVPNPEYPGDEIECVEYYEHGSKNRPGGRHQLNLANKNSMVVHYSRPELGSQCHVYLLRLYLSKLPEVPDKADRPWYGRNVVGHNVLDKYLKRMLKAAGIESANKSNHSLKATAITRLMEKGTPAKLIMERSGHLIESGLSSYVRAKHPCTESGSH